MDMFWKESTREGAVDVSMAVRAARRRGLVAADDMVAAGAAMSSFGNETGDGGKLREVRAVPACMQLDM
jgi:hypothetical protein